MNERAQVLSPGTGTIARSVTTRTQMKRQLFRSAGRGGMSRAVKQGRRAQHWRHSMSSPLRPEGPAVKESKRGGQEV